MTPADLRSDDDERLTRYLLGELAADDEAALDEALLTDDAVWQAARQVEDDLIDAYLAGQVGADRRQRLEARLASSPRLRARVEVARDLRSVARAAPRPGWAMRLRHWLIAQTSSPARLALAGVAVIAVVLVVVRPGGPDGGPRGPVRTASLLLEPTTRGTSSPAVSLRGRAALDLTVALDPEDSFPRYRLRIVGAAGEVWSGEVAAGPPTAASIGARVLSASLPPGAYQLELTGVPAAGAPVALGARGFHVEP